MIKVDSLHQLVPRPCHIFTTEGIGPGSEINIILHEPNLLNSLTYYFEIFDEGQTLEDGRKIQSNVYTRGGRIRLYSIVTYLTCL